MMRKRGFAALWLLLLSSSSALAEWRLVSDDGFSKIYVDATMSKPADEQIVSVSALTDYDPNSREAKDFGLADKGLSEIEAVSFDCAKGRYKSQGGAWFKDHMGRGEIVKRYGEDTEWKAIPRYYDALAVQVCSK